MSKSSRCSENHPIRNAYEAVRDWLGLGPADTVVITVESHYPENIAHVDTLKGIPLTFEDGRGLPPKAKKASPRSRKTTNIKVTVKPRKKPKSPRR